MTPVQSVSRCRLHKSARTFSPHTGHVVVTAAGVAAGAAFPSLAAVVAACELLLLLLVRHAATGLTAPATTATELPLETGNGAREALLAASALLALVRTSPSLSAGAPISPAGHAAIAAGGGDSVGRELSPTPPAPAKSGDAATSVGAVGSGGGDRDVAAVGGDST